MIEKNGDSPGLKEEKPKHSKKRLTKNLYSVIIIAIILIVTSIIVYSYRYNTTEPTEASDIKISFTPNPVLCEDGQWRWEVNISENSEAITNLKTFSRKIYRGDECLVTYTYDEMQIEKWLDSKTLTASSPLSFDAGFPCQEVTHEIDIVKGIDKNGNHVEASGKIDFLF